LFFLIPVRPFNPTRRNRNIGTSAQGHGQDNRLVIPDPRGPRRYEELLSAFEVETLEVHGLPMLFISEKLNDGWFHACSAFDVSRVLNLMPQADLHSLGCILFRQPSRKQSVLNPSWGRLTYWASVGASNQPNLYDGPLITLEACQKDLIMKWPKSLSVESQRELERLREDGHIFQENSRAFVIRATRQGVRQTQLHRTLLHELGHWVDFLEKVERPSAGDLDERQKLRDIYFARPSSEREAYAHRYAETQRKRLPERPL
jgi:hypothetical protein